MRRDVDGVDGDRVVSAAIRLSLEIERREGAPQDVEWADDGETTWIVQARPITVGRDSIRDGFDDPVDDAELTTAGIDEMLPGVFPRCAGRSPPTSSTRRSRSLVEDLGAGSDHHGAGADVSSAVCRGRAAMDFDALRDLARRLPGGSVDELETQYFGSQRRGGPSRPSETTPVGGRRLRHDVRSLRVRKRSSLDAEIVVHAVDALGRGRDLSSTHARRLAAYQFRLIDLAVRAAAAELAVASSATSSYRKIELLLAPHLGDVEAGALDRAGHLGARHHGRARSRRVGGRVRRTDLD